MDNVFSVEVKNAQQTLRQIRDGQRVSHRDIADAYGYLLVANMSNALGEEDIADNSTASEKRRSRCA